MPEVMFVVLWHSTNWWVGDRKFMFWNAKPAKGILAWHFFR